MTDHAEPAGYQHEALPYAGRARFASSCLDLVQDGLAHDERLIVLAVTDKLDEVRDELGTAAEDVTFVATDRHGRNPSRITSMLHSFQAAGDGRHATGVNETTLVGRSPAALAEAQLADYVLNQPSIRSWPMSIVCLYDTEELGPELVASMQQSHAFIRNGTSRPNPDFDAELAARVYASPLDPPPVGAVRMGLGGGQLGQMRNLVRSQASSFGVDADRVEDLVLAVNEIVTNSVRHGGGRAGLALWSQDKSMICEIRDAGHIADPLVGRFAPVPAATSGRGVWLANHLCDLVQLRSSREGTVVRLFMER